MTTREYSKRIQRLNLRQAVKAAIRVKSDEIANLQAIQMSKGKKRDGNAMPDYSPVSVLVYGKRPGPWTLKHTGAFYKGLTVKEINDRGWRITSIDPKTPMLVRKAGQKIFGLNDETRSGGMFSEPLATGILLPEIKKQCEWQTKLKF